MERAATNASTHSTTDAESAQSPCGKCYRLKLTAIVCRGIAQTTGLAYKTVASLVGATSQPGSADIQNIEIHALETNKASQNRQFVRLFLMQIQQPKIG